MVFQEYVSYILIAALLSLIEVALVTDVPPENQKMENAQGPLSHTGFVEIYDAGVLSGPCFYFMTPLVSGIVSRLDSIELRDISSMISEPLSQVNDLMHRYFPRIDPSVTIESLLWTELNNILHPQILTRFFGSGVVSDQLWCGPVS